MKPCSPISILRALLSALLFLGLASPFCSAQTEPIWRLIETGLTPEPIFDEFVFQDTLHGYAYRNGGFYTQITAVTTDGGRTWAPGDLGPAQGFSYGDTIILPDGRISFDRGKTFAYMNPSGADTLLTASGVFKGTAASSQRFAALFVGGQLFEDPFGALGKIRMAWTTDGGESWQTADSAAYDPAQQEYVLIPRAGYGPFPGTELTRWCFFAGYTDTSHLLVVRSTDTSAVPEYYLGLLDLAQETATWTTLPFWKGISSDGADALPLIRIFLPHLLIAHDPSNTEGNYLWKSTDTGKTWTPLDYSPRIRLDDLRVINDSVWYTSGEYSRDGGRTWTQHNVFWLFGPDRSFYPVTENRFLVGGGPLIARSEDGGKTWVRNAPALPITTMIARDGFLAEARGRHMLRLSADNGESWNDRGDVSGELPANLNSIRGLAWYDAATAPNRFFGVAIFVPEADSPYVAVIETRDGGLTWTEHEKIEGVHPVNQIPASLQFVPGTNGQDKIGYMQILSDFYKSTNEGESWTKIRRWEPILNPRTVMLDELHGIHIDYNRTPAIITTTKDGAETWDTVDLPIEFKGFSQVTFIPGTTEARVAAYTADSNVYLLSSADGTTDWQMELLPEAPTGSGEWVWLDGNQLFVRSEGALYYSGDGGDSFDTVQTLPTTGAVFSPPLVAHDSRYLYFDMNPLGLGRRLITPESTTGITFHKAEETGLALEELSASDGAIRFRYRAEAASPLRVELFTLLGNRVAGKRLEGGSGGLQRDELQAGDLPSGNYLLRISGENGEMAVGLIGIGR